MFGTYYPEIYELPYRYLSNTVTKRQDVGYFEEHFGIHVHVDT